MQKFTGINFCGWTNVNYFMQTQLLRFCKNTTKVSSLPLLKITSKSTHFLPVKKKIPILWVELQTNKIQKVSKPFIKTPSCKKNCKLQRLQKMWIKKQHNFSKNQLFQVHSSILSTCTNQCTKNELFVKIYLVNVNISA